MKQRSLTEAHKQARRHLFTGSSRARGTPTPARSSSSPSSWSRPPALRPTSSYGQNACSMSAQRQKSFAPPGASTLVAHLHHCVLVIASQYLGPRVARVCLALDIPADHRLRSVGGRSRCVEVRPQHPTRPLRTGNPLKSIMKSGVSSPISQISPALTNPDEADDPAPIDKPARPFQ